MNWIWVMKNKHLIDMWVGRLAGRHARAGFGSVEDIKQEAYFYFAQKASIYDPTRSSPTTFIRWHVMAVNIGDYRKRKREPASALRGVSWNGDLWNASGQPVSENDGEEVSAGPPMVETPYGSGGRSAVGPGSNLDRMEFEERLSCLNETEKYVARLLINGYTQTEIARMHDVNQMRISRMIQKMRPKLRREYADRLSPIPEGRVQRPGQGEATGEGDEGGDIPRPC